MATNRISTAGCTGKFKQRAPRKKKAPDDDDGNEVIQRVLNSMGGPSKKPQNTETYTIKCRSADDAIMHRYASSKPRKRKKLNSSVPVSVTSRSTPIIEETHPHLQIDHDDIQELDDVIKSIIGSGEYQLSEWENRQKETTETWQSARAFLFQTILQSHAGPILNDLESPPICNSAHCTNPSIVKCNDCMGGFMCGDCDEIVHQFNPCHDRLTWKDEAFTKCPPEYCLPFFVVGQTCEHCLGADCIHKADGSYIAITVKGRFEIPRMAMFCQSCRKLSRRHELQNLVSRGFIPASPDITKTSYIFSMNVIDLWHKVSNNLPGSSLHGFIGALGDISAKHGRKSTINHTAFSRVKEEFGFIESEIELIKKKDPLKCPPCSISQLMCHIDGLHKLYRYKNVSVSKQEAYHSDRFIVKDSKVADHVRDVYESHPTKSAAYQDIYCGSSKWKAARQNASKKTKIDETGLVVAGCRHAIAQKAVNMLSGELYAYSHYLHVNYLLPNNIQFIWQDVVCKYWPWANKVAQYSPVWKSAVNATKPALSVMHAKAHSWHCQVCWGGRYVDGAGGGSGEDMEQFFSYCSRIGNTTKHMSAGRRIDSITDHVLFWNKRKIRALPEILSRRYQRTRQQLIQRTEQLQEEKVTESTQKKWTAEVVKIAEEASNPPKALSQSQIVAKYFKLTQQLEEATALQDFVTNSSLGLSAMVGSEQLFDIATRKLENMPSVRSEIAKLEAVIQPSVGNDLIAQGKMHVFKKTLHDLQRELELTVTSIKQRKLAIENLADSSKQRTKFRRKIEVEKRNAEAIIKKIHQIQLVMDPQSNELSMDDILNGQFPWQVDDSVDLALKRKVADLYVAKKRLEEEEPLLRGEMRNFLRYHMDVRASLMDDIDTLMTKIQSMDGDSESGCFIEPSCTRYEADIRHLDRRAIVGLISLKHQGRAEAKESIERALTCFKRVTSIDGWQTMEIEEDDIIEDEAEDEGEDNVLVLSSDI